jgi:hypothetical protein
MEPPEPQPRGEETASASPSSRHRRGRWTTCPTAASPFPSCTARREARFASRTAPRMTRRPGFAEVETKREDVGCGCRGAAVAGDRIVPGFVPVLPSSYSHLKRLPPFSLSITLPFGSWSDPALWAWSHTTNSFTVPKPTSCPVPITWTRIASESTVTDRSSSLPDPKHQTRGEPGVDVAWRLQPGRRRSRRATCFLGSSLPTRTLTSNESAVPGRSQ